MRMILVNVLILFVTSLLMVAGRTEAADFRAIHENRLGIGLLEEERAREAEAQFLSALTHDPFNPILRYNLGVAYLLQKKYDWALKEFESVLRQPNLENEIAFLAHFNAAIAAQELKKIDEALDHYQGALQYKPDSRETRVNIELLTSGQAGQQGGQGQKDGQEPQDQDQQGQGPSQDPQQNPASDDGNQKQQKPQNFTKDEIKKILEELERQEQKVRALEYGTKGGREKGPGKDW